MSSNEIAILSQTFVIVRHRFERFKGTLMIDMFDENNNRCYAHFHAKDGEIMFESFKDKARLHRTIETPTSEIHSIYDVIEILKDQGVKISYIGGNE